MSEIIAKNDASLTARQKKAVASLVAGASKIKAAADCGVSPRTIERWLNDPYFNHELHKRSEFAIRRAAIRLTAMLDVANSVLYSAMTDKTNSATIKLRAANQVYGHALKLVETSEILRRLDELERRIAHELHSQN